MLVAQTIAHMTLFGSMPCKTGTGSNIYVDNCSFPLQALEQNMEISSFFGSPHHTAHNMFWSEFGAPCLWEPTPFRFMQVSKSTATRAPRTAFKRCSEFCTFGGGGFRV